MPEEVQQIEVNWREVTKLILLAQGITSGLWLPGVNLRLAGAMAGRTREEQLPSGVVSVSGIRLRQVTTPGPLVFDAAELIKENLPVEVLQPAERKGRSVSKKSSGEGGRSLKTALPASPRKRKAPTGA